ncbi:hypothetical protein ABIB40_003775 [Pedobacter sp. UYP30]|uniref:hypothetical protein n=1 Tax=Pedobacter sp. UYP30 TaxID=1756400 RepID=UPI0033965FBC
MAAGNTETQPYQIVKTEKDFEICHYLEAMGITDGCEELGDSRNMLFLLMLPQSLITSE